MMEYVDPWLDPGYFDCKYYKYNGLLLSNKYVLQEWGEQTDQLVERQKSQDFIDGILDKWDDIKYDRTERVRIAQHVANPPHGILTAMNIALDPALVDVAHGFWSFMGLCQNNICSKKSDQFLCCL